MFKVGQKVVCIKAGSFNGRELLHGATYTVSAINVIDTINEYIQVDGSDCWVYASRFKDLDQELATYIGTGCFINPESTNMAEAAGVKHDQEKPDMSLLSSIALTKVAHVMTFGKKKYSANNWRGGIAWTRLLAASLRHVFAYLGGQDKDPETGLSHLAHAVCCLMMLLEFEDTHIALDDRYKVSK